MRPISDGTEFVEIFGKGNSSGIGEHYITAPPITKVLLTGQPSFINKALDKPERSRLWHAGGDTKTRNRGLALFTLSDGKVKDHIPCWLREKRAVQFLHAKLPRLDFLLQLRLIGKAWPPLLP